MLGGEHRLRVDLVHRLADQPRGLGHAALPFGAAPFGEGVLVQPAEAGRAGVAVLVQPDAVGPGLAQHAGHGVGHPAAILGHVVAHPPGVVVVAVLAVGLDDAPTLALLPAALRVVVHAERIGVERDQGAPSADTSRWPARNAGRPPQRWL